MTLLSVDPRTQTVTGCDHHRCPQSDGTSGHVAVPIEAGVPERHH